MCSDYILPLCLLTSLFVVVIVHWISIRLIFLARNWRACGSGVAGGWRRLITSWDHLVETDDRPAALPKAAHTEYDVGPTDDPHGSHSSSAHDEHSPLLSSKGSGDVEHQPEPLRSVPSHAVSSVHHESHHGLARYAGTLMALCLLGYEGVSSATLDLLHCVPFGDDLVLFRSGHVACYTRDTLWWQVLLYVVLLLLLLFPLGLIWFRSWARGESLWARTHEKNKYHHHPAPWAHAVLDVLEGSYRAGCAWWETMGMYRRLGLVVIFTFVVDPLIRVLALTGGCLLIFLLHLWFRPNVSRTYDLVEAGFLCNLMVISMLQVPEATRASLGLPIPYYRGLGITSGVFVALPLAYCVLAVFVLSTPKVVRWLITWFRWIWLLAQAPVVRRGVQG